MKEFPRVPVSNGKVHQGIYPFRLGTTSYIIPDDILPNARYLAPWVDDIELVLFESPDFSNIPGPEDIEELAELGKRHDCGYSVHLPIDRKAGSADPRERQAFKDGADRIVERFIPLDPGAWVVHLEGIGPHGTGQERQDWQGYCNEFLTRLVTMVPDPGQVVIENLGYPWDWHRTLADDHGCSLCCDVGHLWLYCPDTWQREAAAMLPDVRVIHLHGERDGKDHLGLAHGDRARTTELVRLIKEQDYRGIVTLEIFNREDFEESVQELEEIWETLR